MKLIRYLIAILIIVGFVTAGFWTASGQTDAPKAGKVVLRLQYRGVLDRPEQRFDDSSNSYKVGVFESELYFHHPDLVGTDWEGNIYIMDPLTPELSALKRFDKNGQFREVWRPIHARYGSGVAVTRDGYIWTGLLGDYEGRPGLPIVVYRKGQKDPVIDWRNKLPKELEDRVRKVLRERGLEWKKGGGAHSHSPEGGTRQVSLRFSGEAVGREGQIARILWILMRSDGSQVLDVKIGKGEIPHLAPDGRLWIRKSDFEVERFTWNTVWLWEKGKERGKPLIDRNKNKEPWGDKFTLGKARPPIIKLDAKGHAYLMWARGDSKPHKRRFVVEGKILDDDFPPPPLEGERALVVLDSQRRLVTYLPWVPNSVEIQDSWVKPLPDGSGFYRIQFFEKEARVFFHPLPQ